MAHQNELHYGVVNLAETFFTPAHMRNNSKIFTGRAVQGRETKEKEKGKCTEAPPPEEVEEKEDLLIRDLWTQGTESIHDMRVVNTDAVSYQSKTPEKCLETAKREKKKKYLNAYLNDHQHFTPFVALVDGPLGVDAEATLKHIASHLTQKGKEPYSRTCGYVKSRLEITLVTSSIPRRLLFLHDLSFECTSKLCINFINQFSVYFHI